ncbi:MAG: hypothetical protein Q9227_009355 [Pyrenula ochraceoflavens]
MAPGNDYPSYLQRIKDQAKRYPVLKLLRLSTVKEFRQSRGSAEISGRAAVIEFWRGSQRGGVVQETREFESPDGLIDYLSQPRRCSRRLFLLEGLCMQYVEAFGSFLDVDPRIFASQSRCVHWDNLGKGVQRTLRSCRNILGNTSQYYTLKYYEIWNLRRLPTSDGNGRGKGYVTAGNPSRAVEISPKSVRDQKSFQSSLRDYRAYLLRGNASFWYQCHTKDSESEASENWDALMLLDPPLGSHLRFKEDSQESVPLSQPRRYQNGYPDLMQWRSSPGQDVYPDPDKITMFDHILYYWRNDPTSARCLKSVEATATHMKQLVATHWNCLLNQSWAALSYLEYNIGQLEEHLAVHDQTKNERREWYRLEKNLRSMNTLRRRMNWYLDQAKENLYQLGIDGPDDEPRDGNFDLARDFADIVTRLEFYKSCSENLVDVAATVASLRQAKEGLVTSYFINLLTMLGVVIFPLTFLCSIFSMGGNFQAGQSHFWVYWAIAVPLAAVLLMLVWFGKRWYIQQQQQSKVQEAEARENFDDARFPFDSDLARGDEKRASSRRSYRMKHSDSV